MSKENQTPEIATGSFKKFFNKNYLGTWVIDPENPEPTVTIDHCERHMVDNTKGGEEPHLVVYFTENLNTSESKENIPLILNNTNAETIGKITGTDQVEKWKGTKIQLYIDNNVRAFGSIVDGLRVRKPVVKTIPELTPKSPKWQAAMKAVKDNKLTKEQLIAKGYKISDANYELLCK